MSGLEYLHDEPDEVNSCPRCGVNDWSEDESCNGCGWYEDIDDEGDGDAGADYQMPPVTCPICGTTEHACYDESNSWFEDAETGEEYEAPVGYFKCINNHLFTDHDQAPNKRLGNWYDTERESWRD